MSVFKRLLRKCVEMFRNKQDIERLEHLLNRVQIRIDEFGEESFDQKIQDAWNQLKIKAGQDNLQKMHVDTLSTLEKRMPINELVNSGFRTIYDLKDINVNELMSIRGVGEKSAHVILDGVSRIKASVYQQASYRIDPDHLSDDDQLLLETIYKKWKLTETAASLQEDLDNLTGSVSSTMETAKKKRGFFGGIFQPANEKAAVILAFRELNRSEYNRKIDNIRKEVIELIEYTVSPEEVTAHFIQENASYYTEIEKVTGFERSEGAEDLPADMIEEINNFPLDTTGLDIELRKYQTFGAKYALFHKRTLLGDEMGLGKTIQALAMINHLFQSGKRYSIVVCPLSVLANWKREIEQHSNLKTFVFHGENRETEFAKWQSEGGIILTTYEHTLRMNFEETNQLDVLIVDEAHYVKNPEAKRTISVNYLTTLADDVLFMSGTPLENRLEEMKQLISVLQSDVANQLSEELHLLQPDEFKKTVASVYLRRNRKDVLAELPELAVIPQWMSFGEEEQWQYQQAVATGQLMLMRRVAWRGGSPEKSPKLEKLLDICNEADENGHKVLVFSFFKDVIHTIRAHVKEKTFEPITGDVPNARRQEIIDAFTEAQPGSVLISQITAGGVGLNIQAANIVILCEPQWKPSTEEQAISRAYRMGQSRDVVVYRLLTEESIDESMLELLGEKAELFDLYARESSVATLAAGVSDEDHQEESLKQKVLETEHDRIKKEVV